MTTDREKTSLREDAVVAISAVTGISAIPFATAGQITGGAMMWIATMICAATLLVCIGRSVALTFNSRPVYIHGLMPLIIDIFGLPYILAIEGLIIMSHGGNEGAAVFGVTASECFWSALALLAIDIAGTVAARKKDKK